MQPETQVVEILLTILLAPAGFHHNGQNLRQRVEAWVSRVIEEMGDEIQEYEATR